MTKMLVGHITEILLQNANRFFIAFILITDY
jgi:hypothetical protein